MCAVVYSHRIQKERKSPLSTLRPESDTFIRMRVKCRCKALHSMFQRLQQLVQSNLIEILQGLDVKMNERPPRYMLWHGMFFSVPMMIMRRMPPWNIKSLALTSLYVVLQNGQKMGRGRIIHIPLLVSFTEPNYFPDKPMRVPSQYEK